jgi:peptidoglycan hydrolase CwlO-like protein
VRKRRLTIYLGQPLSSLLIIKRDRASREGRNPTMKRSLLVASVTATLALASFSPGLNTHPVFASKLTDLKGQKEQINEEKSEVNSEINEAENKITSIQNQQEQVKQDVQRLDIAIGDTDTKIREKSVEIETKEGEIAQLQTEVAQLIERISKRNEMLKDRARSFQETGGRVTYLEVLMGAQSFSDFIDRVGAVATILEADQGILRQHKDDKRLLEEKQVKVEQELTSLEKMLVDLESMNAQLNEQRDQKDGLIAQLEQQEEQIHAEVLELEEQAQILAAQQAAVQQAIRLEEERQAELARQAAEAAKGGGGTPAPTPVVSNGAWTRPAAGIITSGLGMRWGSYHAGIDIANRVSVPILAAADGVVLKSYYSPSYGNAIFLTHFINGKIYTTVYAHMSSRTVSSGAVSKGQVIGYMGNTGYSTGQHLHFELHVGEWNASKSNAVNPLNYIPM